HERLRRRDAHLPRGERPLRMVHAVRFPVVHIVEGVPARGEGRGGSAGPEQRPGELPPGSRADRDEAPDPHPDRGHHAVPGPRDNMFGDKDSGLGCLKTTKARHAEEAIGHTEGLVTVLRLTMADIKPAEATLAIAKQFFDAHQYAKAVQAAKRAESIAIKLDERFGQYQRALHGLQSQIGSMTRLGLDTEAIAKVDGRAEEKVVAGISEDVAFVANYLEARDILVRATQEGRAFQEESEIAS